MAKGDNQNNYLLGNQSHYFESFVMEHQAIAQQSNSFGSMLKQWRNRRNLSQLNLALSSHVSQRHISFLESGRAQPSQAMILHLATVLEIPLRHQNLMLSAAGFAPIHSETDLLDPEMASICKAIDLILQQQEPYPAFVVDRYWNLLMSNQGAIRLFHTFIEPDKFQAHFGVDGKTNLMRAMFDPQGFRPFIVNWEACARHLLQRVFREAKASIDSEQSHALFDELITYPGVRDLWITHCPASENTLLLTMQLTKNNLNLQFFSTIATLGTPYDITLQELRIECLFPADEETENNWRRTDLL